MKYRAEIDGLRALAVIPVILFHAHIPFFKGGYLGVDIFFVISGYLITTIIYDELLQQKFSLVTFYERRARRILPALIFVVFATLIPAWLWMLPYDFQNYSQSVASVFLFSSNFLFWLETDYFSQSAELKPLLHTWSLAVEEQYYLLFPLILMCIWKLKKVVLLSTILVICIISLFFAQWLSNVDASANFYLLPSRAWELGAGSIVALAFPRLKSTNINLANLLSAVGLFIVLASLATYDELNTTPGLDTLIPIIGVCLIIAFAQKETLVAKILSNKLLVGVGLISYSAYLWHQPLFAFVRIRSINTPNYETFIFLTFLTFALAFLTWKYIEAPFRNKRTIKKKSIFQYSAIASITFIVIGISGHTTKGFPQRIPEHVLSLNSEKHSRPAKREICLSNPKKYIQPGTPDCVFNPDFETRVALWGDSHAEAVSEVLASALSKENIGLQQFTFSGCPSAINYRRSDISNGYCKRFNEETLSYLITSDINTIILISRWTQYIEGERFNNMEGGIELGKPTFGLPTSMDPSDIESPLRVTEIGKTYRGVIEHLTSAGKKVVLVYPIPEVAWNVPDTLVKKALYEGQTNPSISTSIKVYTERHKKTFNELKPIEHLVTSVYPHRLFCDLEGFDERCIAAIQGKALYYDDDHLSKQGAEVLSKSILAEMMRSTADLLIK